ncbi:MAG: biotin--[acetyl-CoA-carboxylase] ligase [Myxococcales bacterium]|jgi:BirA family biotin operon repressor/biotin-[acetyl-CoA-carboxylase] ligase
MGEELHPERVARHLWSERFGRSLRVLAETDSTNDDALQDARGGAADGHVVVADSQRAGRGSNGRTWASPAGTDLYLSIVTRPQLSLPQLPPLTLAVGLAVADAAAELTRAAAPDGESLATEVKWPNDVWLAGRKTAGILIEASSNGAELGPVIIGIGLNVNRERWPEPLQDSATSLRLASGSRAPLDRARTLGVLLRHVERWVDRFTGPDGAEHVARSLDSRLALRGRAVRCGDARGVVRGVAPNGALILEVAGQATEVYSGRLLPE